MCTMGLRAGKKESWLIDCYCPNDDSSITNWYPLILSREGLLPLAGVPLGVSLIYNWNFTFISPSNILHTSNICP